MSKEKKRNIILRAFAGAGSLILWVLSFKIVRNAIYKKVDKKVDEKIIDVKAKLDK